MAYKYKHAALAGTFDRLHSGHEHFLVNAFSLAQKVLIGLTSDEFARRKRISGNIEVRINLFTARKDELVRFLKKKEVYDRAEIVEIDDVYGPILKQNDIDVLILTVETLTGGEEVNRKRSELGLPKLTIEKIPLLNASDKQRISSTRIREGEIDRWGRVFAELKVFGGKIGESLRNKLKNPLGKLISGSIREIEDEVKELAQENDPIMVISVGDEATKYLNKLKLYPNIAIIDFHIKRIKVHENLEELMFTDEFYKAGYRNKILKAENPPGFITSALVTAIKTGLKEFIKDGLRRVVQVTGEEDLAGIPAILLAPLGSIVFYGQPDKGIVSVFVTEEKKMEILDIFTKNAKNEAI